MSNKQRFLSGETCNVWIEDSIITKNKYLFTGKYLEGKFMSIGHNAPSLQDSPSVIIREDHFVLDFQKKGHIELKTPPIYFDTIMFK